MTQPGRPKLRAAIFDLDGTLADTLEDIARAVNFALTTHGEPGHPLAVYPSIIGGGAENLIRKALRPTAQEKLAAVFATYRGYYAEHLLDHSRPFLGIPELLNALITRGIRVAVLSNKPDAPTQKLVSALFGALPLSPVFGERAGIPKKPDPTSALEIAKMLEVSPSQCAFVGDTGIDITTAKNAGMLPVGVMWGFRPEELRPAGAEHLAEEPAQLLSIIS